MAPLFSPLFLQSFQPERSIFFPAHPPDIFYMLLGYPSPRLILIHTLPTDWPFLILYSSPSASSLSTLPARCPKDFAKTVDNIYISIDIDVIDPAFAPGTGWPEPLGIWPQQLATLLEFLKATKKVRGFDIVEVSPPQDMNNITSSLAARLLLELVK